MVLPVAVVSEKAGTFLDWEGRPRPFGQVFRDAMRDSDAAVLVLAEHWQISDRAVCRSFAPNLGAWVRGQARASPLRRLRQHTHRALVFVWPRGVNCSTSVSCRRANPISLLRRGTPSPECLVQPPRATDCQHPGR